MAQPRELKKGDRCPNCGGQFEEAQVPTAKERAAATNRDNPIDLPPHYDNASEDQRNELGALYRCERCGYKTRFPLEPKDKGKGRGKSQPAAAAAAGGDDGDEPDGEQS